jgi:hypothetical protein
MKGEDDRLAAKEEHRQLPLADLFGQSVYSRIAGYEDVNDAERLSQDPTFRLIGSEKTWDRGAAATSRVFSPRNQQHTCRPLPTTRVRRIGSHLRFAGTAPSVDA